MTDLRIWVADHRGTDSTSLNSLAQERNRIDRENADFQQPESEHIKVWNPRTMGGFDERYYADYNAFSGPWLYDFKTDIIGFFGYRKYLWRPEWFPLEPKSHCDHAPGWVHVSKPDFDAYRRFLQTWDWAPVRELLKTYDLIQAAPYIYSNDSITDFVQHCGSPTSGKALLAAVRKHGLYPPAWNLNYPNFLMITRWEVYDHMMREIHPIMMELDEFKGEDSADVHYTERPNLYYLERIYPLWLRKSGLRFIEAPMLHCRAIGPQAPGW
jgi:hypothetical protein